MRKKLISCLKVLCFSIAAMTLLANCDDGGGSSGGGDTLIGNCGACTGSCQAGTVCHGNCAPGFWCSPFLTGPSRCVPDSKKPNDPYMCTTTTTLGVGGSVDGDQFWAKTSRY